MAFCKRTLATLIVATLAALCCMSALATPADYDMNAPQNLTADHLYAESALLVDQDSGAVLFSKNARVRMYPASTTKIMTLLLALESDIPLDAQVTVPAEAADIPEGSSVIPVKPGDELSFSDLLYGFMLSSGNDGANAIAVLVDGSREAFVKRMNRRAKELGCEGTHFVNAHGYHNSDHYTTAQDLATMSIEAMRNETFRKIVAAPTWTLTIRRGINTVTSEIVSRNSLLQSGEKYYYPDCTGIKTGHHNKAGWCFVGSAEREGKRVICVVLNCEEEMSKWYDAARLFEYGFTRYAPVPVSQLLDRSRERIATARIENAAADDPQDGLMLMDFDITEGADSEVQLVIDSDVSMNAALDGIAKAARVEWTRPLEAPVSQGERMGALTLTLPDGGQLKADLIASRDVAEPVQITPEPTDAPIPTAQAADVTPKTDTSREGSGGNGVLLAIFGLLLLLGFAGAAAVAVASRSRKARRRRRRPRPASGVRRNPGDAHRNRRPAPGPGNRRRAGR